MPRWSRWAPLVAYALFAAVYTVLSVARYDRVDVRSWDLAIFSQAARSYAERGYPLVDIKGPEVNLLGDHFSPVIALFGPLWAVAPSPVTLLVVQAVLLAFSVAVVLATAVRHLGPFPGTAVGLAYGLSFGLVQAADFDVHEVAFAAPLLALAGAAYLRRDWRWVALWSGALVLVKEDQGVTVIAVGLVLLLVGARRWGIGLIAFGLVATLLVLLVVIPLLNDGGYDYWSRLSGADGEGNPVPWLLRAFWPAEKLETLLLTFAITGFLALRSPWVLVALPTLGWRFLSDYDAYWGTEWHYSLTLMPIVFVAMIDGILRARTSRPRWLARYAEQGAAVALTAALVLAFQYPLRDLVEPSTYADTAREQAAEKVVDRIPDGDSVDTDIGLIAPLVPDHDVTFIGTNLGPDMVTPDWVVVDTRLGWQGGGIARWAQGHYPGTRWEDVPVGGGYLLAKRVD